MWFCGERCQIVLTSTMVLLFAVCRVDASLLEFHLTAASWDDARRICSKNNGALMTRHFLVFAGIRNETWFDSSQSMWTGFYWLDTGFGNVLMDDNCQGTSAADIETSELQQVTAAASSHRCVLVNYTSTVSLQSDDCEKKLPFACEIEARLEPSVFDIFEFNKENYAPIQGIDLATCRDLCLEGTALPCRSLVFISSSNSCLLMSQKYTLPNATLDLSWKPTYTHAIVDTYTDKIASLSDGNVINKLDADAAEVRTGSSGVMCELQCAWLNQECTCADYANGKCRIFSTTSDCQTSLLIPSVSDAVTIIKTFGNPQALYLKATNDPLPAASLTPPQLNCQIPTPTPDPNVLATSTMALPEDISTLVAQSPGIGFVTGIATNPRMTTIVFDNGQGSSVAAVHTVNGLYTLAAESDDMELKPTLIDDSGAALEATLTPIRDSTRSLQPVMVDQVSGITLINTLPLEESADFHPPTSLDDAATTRFDLPTPVQETIYIPWSSGSRQSDRDVQGTNTPSGSYWEQEESLIFDLVASTPNFIDSNMHYAVTSTTVPSVADDTYVIYKSGDVMSSLFECDITVPLASLNIEESRFTTFACRFLSAHTRGLAINDTEFMDRVVDFLTIDKTKISSYRRRYESAYDGRTSARNVGIVGIIVLATVFGGLILLDLTSFKRDIQLMITNTRS